MWQLDREKIQQAHKFLEEESTSVEKFNAIILLLKGVSPKIDQKLAAIGKVLDSFEKLQKGDIIELSINGLPENTEEEKRRKKVILFLVKNFKDLKSEVDRAKAEIQSQGSTPSTFAKIAAKAKGPFGLVTLVAVIIATSIILLNQKEESSKSEQNPTPQTVSRTGNKIQVIRFNQKFIPLSELVARKGVDCNQEDHYHAKNGQSVKALDGSTINDSGSCAFGKVSEAKIEEADSH